MLTNTERTALAINAQRFADGADDLIRTEQDANAWVRAWVANPNQDPDGMIKPSSEEEIAFFTACVWAIVNAGWQNIPLRPTDTIIAAHAYLNARPA